MPFPGMPKKFTVDWTEIEPTGMHGGLPNVVGEGWQTPDINDNPITTNTDIFILFNDLMRHVTALSIHVEADMDALPGNSLVKECMDIANTFFEDVADRTRSQAQAMFSFQHPIPPVNTFQLTPVMYPVASTFAMEFLHYALGTLVALAENSRNAAHKGLDPEAAHIILSPLYYWKADQMKIWFNYEVENEMSAAELATAMGTVRPRRVLSTPDETDERPSAETVAEALAGVNVLNWVPDQSDWALFADTRIRRYSPERIRQPENSRAVTEDALPNSGVGQDGQPAISHGNSPSV